LRYKTTYQITEAQMSLLREIADATGMERKRLERIAMGFGFPPDDPDAFPFLGEQFKVGAEASVSTCPDERDLEAIAGWISEASARADIVIVSLHAHEDGGEKETPAEFLQIAARRMIDAGAHVIAGHGPHLLRGMEMYKGAPIFYSLGNFIGQNDLTFKLPSDSYEQFRVDRDQHAGAIFRQRSQDGSRSFPADKRYWEALMPVCTWKERALVSIELHPVTLRLEPRPSGRGRPALAEGAEAVEILDRFARLSAGFGTNLEKEPLISLVSHA
jgi:poly-gamma-glutamate synthesis protein (capsule biosynthesis protein)